MSSAEVQHPWMGNWKNHWNVVGMIDLGVGRTKLLNGKFTVAGIGNYIWFQNSASIYMASSQCLNQFLVIWPSLGFMFNFWIHTNRKGKKKTFCVSDKVLLNAGQKIRFKQNSLQQSIIGETRHHETPERPLVYL